MIGAGLYVALHVPRSISLKGAPQPLNLAPEYLPIFWDDRPPSVYQLGLSRVFRDIQAGPVPNLFPP